MISVHFQGKPFSITVIQIYARPVTLKKLKLNSFIKTFKTYKTSLVAQTVKNLPSVQETWIRSLDQEDPLESETAPDSSIPAWRIPCTEEPGGLQSMGSQRVRHD